MDGWNEFARARLICSGTPRSWPIWLWGPIGSARTADQLSGDLLVHTPHLESLQLEG